LSVYSRKSQERAIKRHLIEELLKIKNYKLEEIVEWLWEEYGIKAKPNIEAIRKTILNNDEITSRELAVEILRSGGFVDEELWFAPIGKNMQDDQ